MADIKTVVKKLSSIVDKAPKISRPKIVAEDLPLTPSEDTAPDVFGAEAFAKLLAAPKPENFGRVTGDLVIPSDFQALRLENEKEMASVLRALPPADQRKLFALELAGAANGSVRDAFKAAAKLTPRVTSIKNLQKGLDLAASQGVNLNAPSW